jgi:lipopolysaccharide export system permease protein
MLRAQTAHWDGAHWRLEGVTETTLSDRTTNTLRAPDQNWVSAVTPDLLLLLMVRPENMSVTALYGYVGHLLENRQDARRYSIALWNKLLYPVAMPVMLLLALAFAFRPPRAGEAGGRLLTGVLLGLGFYLASRMLSQMTLLQAWPAWVSALTPILLFGSASLAMLWWADRH